MHFLGKTMQLKFSSTHKIIKPVGAGGGGGGGAGVSTIAEGIDGCLETEPARDGFGATFGD